VCLSFVCSHRRTAQSREAGADAEVSRGCLGLHGHRSGSTRKPMCSAKHVPWMSQHAGPQHVVVMSHFLPYLQVHWQIEEQKLANHSFSTLANIYARASARALMATSSFFNVVIHIPIHMLVDGCQGCAVCLSCGRLSTELTHLCKNGREAPTAGKEPKREMPMPRSTESH